MYKTFIAGITALSLTFAPVQVSAEGMTDRQIGQLILGLVAAGIIGKAISDNNRDDDAAPTPIPLPPRNLAPLRQQQPTGRQNEAHSRNGLPSNCLNSYETQRGEQSIFGARCLDRNYAQARSLPDQCFIRLRTYDGPVQGYTPSCLREYGFRTDRHRY